MWCNFLIRIEKISFNQFVLIFLLIFENGTHSTAFVIFLHLSIGNLLSGVFKSALNKHVPLKRKIRANQGFFLYKQLCKLKLNLLLVDLNKLRNKYLKYISEKVTLIINKQKMQAVI